MNFEECLRWMLANGFSTVIWPPEMSHGCGSATTHRPTREVLEGVIATPEAARRPLVGAGREKQYFIEVAPNMRGELGAWVYAYPRPTILTSDVHIALTKGASVVDDRRGISTPTCYRHPYYCGGLGPDADAASIVIPVDAPRGPDDRDVDRNEPTSMKVYVPNRAFARLFESWFAGLSVDMEFAVTSEPAPLSVGDDGWRELLLDCGPRDLDAYAKQETGHLPREWRVPIDVLREVCVNERFLARADDDVSLADGPFDAALAAAPRIRSVTKSSTHRYHVALEETPPLAVDVVITGDAQGPYRVAVNDWLFYACPCKRKEVACRRQHSSGERTDDELVAMAIEAYRNAHLHNSAGAPL